MSAVLRSSGKCNEAFQQYKYLSYLDVGGAAEAPLWVPSHDSGASQISNLWYTISLPLHLFDQDPPGWSFVVGHMLLRYKKVTVHFIVQSVIPSLQGASLKSQRAHYSSCVFLL